MSAVQRQARVGKVPGGGRRRAPRARVREPRTAGDVAVTVVTFAVLAVLAFPVLWVALTSLRPAEDLLSTDLQILPEGANLRAYRELLGSDFVRYIGNSLLVCLSATVVSVFLSLMAAYAFSRRDFRGRGWLLTTVALSQLFPFIALITPVYATFSQLGLVNTYVGLFLAYIAITAPFSVYLLVGYLDGIPRELDDAAFVDGAGTFTALVRVIAPAAWPGLVVTATYAFIMAWEEYLFAAALVTDKELWTVPVGLAGYFGEYSSRWDLIMAASVLTTAPTLILFLLLQRRLAAGLVAGAVKS